LSLVKRSFYELRDYIIDFIPDDVEVYGTHEFKNTWNNDKYVRYDKYG